MSSPVGQLSVGSRECKKESTAASITDVLWIKIIVFLGESGAINVHMQWHPGACKSTVAQAFSVEKGGSRSLQKTSAQPPVAMV